MFFRKKLDYDQLFAKYLDSDFVLFPVAENPPSKSDLTNFEKQFSISLPGEFRDLYNSRLGGVYIEVKETIWPRPKAYEAGPFWSFLYALHVYSFSADSPEWLNIHRQAEAFTKNVNPNYVPFLKIVGDADVYCFDKSGSIFQWDHELDQFNKIEKSFNQLLEYEIAELKRRKGQKKAGKP
ncbi:MAG TPA: SMI1/KNR4 family protein [Puia sp.]|uniref:SMI1/KNR4 family protein n=1 Tax=Puia sp. TaxID=2045100 RepID=UPI002BAE2F06|nr:SMI1/KNR4 family protein [Puia sp.]HVU95284.1 SMI1/KNR4 family protein [Puia sp.]